MKENSTSWLPQLVYRPTLIKEVCGITIFHRELRTSKKFWILLSVEHSALLSAVTVIVEYNKIIDVVQVTIYEYRLGLYRMKWEDAPN